MAAGPAAHVFRDFPSSYPEFLFNYHYIIVEIPQMSELRNERMFR